MTNDDRVRIGAAEIGLLIGKSRVETSYLLMKHQLPCFKLGGKWHLRPSRYYQWREDQENATLARGEELRAQREPRAPCKQPTSHILRQRRRAPARTEPAEPAALSAAPLSSE